MKAFLFCGVLLLMVPMAIPAGEPAPQRDGRFLNQVELPKDGVLKKLRIGVKYLLLRKPPQTRPDAALTLQPMTRQQVADAPDHSLWRLGHSTVLLKRTWTCEVAGCCRFITAPSTCPSTVGRSPSSVSWPWPIPPRCN
ncbi:hypothetical protein WR25_08020 [Diploscapter pachys]|uniref:Uncharacterized protein n=1 Tax=Diploscapter pachys TaxID=2018661 RepID=A0A2A2KJ02_9BILA|nr:hypothetical protein WR25_08020 [Diploscapter pachys]